MTRALGDVADEADHLGELAGLLEAVEVVDDDDQRPVDAFELGEDLGAAVMQLGAGPEHGGCPASQAARSAEEASGGGCGGHRAERRRQAGQCPGQRFG